MIYSLLLVSSFGLLYTAIILKGNILSRSIHAWLDASENFTDWRNTNPSVYIGLSDKGKALLTALIRAYDDFLTHHPYINGTDHREYLMSLFDDFPPLRRKPKPKTTPKDSAQIESFYS